MLHCPDDPTPQNTDPRATGNGQYNGPGAYTSYFYNAVIGVINGGFTDKQGGIKLAQMPYVASTILVGDNDAYNASAIIPFNEGRSCNWKILDPVKGGFNCGYSHAGGYGGYVGTLSKIAANRHSDGANCAFADGHAKYYKPSALWGAASTFTTGVVHAGNQDYPGLGISGTEPTFNATNE